MKIVYINAENLFITKDSIPQRHALEKSPKKAKELARFIQDMNPDITWIIEVGGQDSIEEFNRIYLQEQYLTSLIPGNSDRGIDIGLLIKKNSGLHFEHYTHKHRPLQFNYPHEIAANQMAQKVGNPPPFQSHKLSRDIGEVRIFKNNSKTPSLIVLCVHLKSQLDPNGIDPKGLNRRQAEATLLTKVVESLEKHFEHKVPVIFGGDFNAAPTDPELQVLSKLKHIELCDALNLPHHDRVSHVYFDKWDKRIEQQMDCCYIPPELIKFIDRENSGIYRWRTEEDSLLPLPQNQFQRYNLASDHYPIVLTLKNPSF